MEEYTEQFIEQLAKRGHILLLGGMAVIAHGLGRVTKDIDRLTSKEESQILNYLKASRLKVGVLLNFGTASLEWKRLVF